MTTKLTSTERLERAANDICTVIHAGALDPQDCYSTLIALRDIASMAAQVSDRVVRATAEASSADDGLMLEHAVGAAGGIGEARRYLDQAERLLDAAVQHVSHMRF